jgi:hypothetical protein
MTNDPDHPADSKAAGEVTKMTPNEGRRLVPVALDRALSIEDAMVQRNLARARQRNSAATPAEVVRSLERMYLSGLTALGAAVGAGAATPGVGTSASRALAGGEVVSTLELSILFVLSLAEVHGLPMDEVERLRSLVLGVILGSSGSKFIPEIAGRTGRYWGRELVDRVPAAALKQVNKVLGRNFVTKYGTKEGIIVLGRIVPFGVGAVIGAGANALLARSAIQAARRAFGPPPTTWPSERDSPSGRLGDAGGSRT